MVLAARLEIDLLMIPSHGPVDPPRQLGDAFLADVDGVFMAADAGVRDAILAVVRFRLGRVLAALLAEDGDRKPILGQFSPIRFGRVEDAFYLFAMLERELHVLCVFACAIHLVLVDELCLDADRRQALLDLDLMMPCVGFVAAERVRCIDNRFS